VEDGDRSKVPVKPISKRNASDADDNLFALTGQTNFLGDFRKGIFRLGNGLVNHFQNGGIFHNFGYLGADDSGLMAAHEP